MMSSRSDDFLTTLMNFIRPYVLGRLRLVQRARSDRKNIDLYTPVPRMPSLTPNEVLWFALANAKKSRSRRLHCLIGELVAFLIFFGF